MDARQPQQLDAIDSEFVILVDRREQLAWQFQGLRAGAEKGHAPLRVRMQSASLRTGDYSVAGFEDCISIERKSLTDLYQSLTRERARFLREIERLAALEVGVVIVESGWAGIMNPQFRTQVNPRSIQASIIALMERYPGCSWLTASHREFAEELAYMCLDRFYRDVQSVKRPSWGPQLPDFTRARAVFTGAKR